MKERKRLGRKKKRKGLSKKESLYGILLAVVIVSILFIYFLLRSPSNQTPSQPSPLKAAIVDHLSLTQPNQTFNQKATNILKNAGYPVDYYSGEEVTVDFYRNLPTHGYSLLVLRVHSTFMDNESVALFTSENYSINKYPFEQLEDQLGAVAFSIEEAEKGIMYFGINPSFVQYCMKGRFNNTVIIMMGCDGLMYTPMAEAFVQKGARVYISWNGPVTASHTDQATTRLLEHLVTERQTIKQAVTETMNEVGPDPVDESILLYYPTTPKAENYVIPEPKSNLTTNVAEINPKIGKAHRHSITMAKIMKKSGKTSIKRGVH